LRSHKSYPARGERRPVVAAVCDRRNPNGKVGGGLRPPLQLVLTAADKNNLKNLTSIFR